MGIGKRQVGKLEKRLQLWGALLHELGANPRGDGVDDTSGYRRHLDDLQSKHQLLQAQFDRLRTADRSERPGLEIGFDTAWRDIEVSFAKLTG
jgi:hypothetical protein